MATGGEDFSYSTGSEDLYDIVCDPCQEDGELHKAVGMCIDCKDHLCQKCYDAHTISKLSRKHKLLDKEAMLQSQISIAKDTCTEKCAVHEDKAIKYYCVDHSHLGCSVCITLDHRTCDNVRYIPHVAKDLDNNEEYQQVESQLISVVERSKKVSQRIKKKKKSIKKKARKMVLKFRKDIDEVLDKVEADLLQQCETIELEETAKLAQIVGTFKTTETDLHALMKIKEAYQNNNQNCNLYTLMMKTKDKVKLAEERMKETGTINEAEIEDIHTCSQIKFVANIGTLNSLKLPDSFGKLLISNTSITNRPEHTKTTEIQKEHMTSVSKTEERQIMRPEYFKDIDVEYKTDTNVCDIIGMAFLPVNRLVTIDFGNLKVKLLDVKRSQVVTCLKLSAAPYDVTMVTNCQVAITMIWGKKVAIVNVGATAMNVERTLVVDGPCYGVDYRDGKLAVSFCHPSKIQVITLQGRVLHSINTDQQGLNFFNRPIHVVFGQDNSSLYASNIGQDSVVNIMFDGTVAGTYTDRKLIVPQALLIDSSGLVYVCGSSSHNILQITQDCRKDQVLLTEADGLRSPRSFSYSEKDCMLYVGLSNNNVIKVYKMIHGSE